MLTIDNKELAGDSPNATARIDEFENCVIEGLVDGVTAEGVCIEDGSAKNAEFTFGVELSGAYNQDQTYYFEFAGDGIKAEDVTSLTYTVGDVTKDVKVTDGKGQFTIEKGDYPDGGKFSVVATVESQGKLKETDSLTLTLDNKDLVGNSPSAEAQIDNFENCAIEAVPPEISITPDAACEVTGGLSDTTAIFRFSVSVDSARDQAQTLDYTLVAKGISDQGYTINAVSFDPADGVSLVEGGANGVISVKAGVEEFSFTAKVTANSELTLEESLQLSLSQDGDRLAKATARLDKDSENCPDPTEDPLEPTDVELYLVLDNSTSMLQPDPSTKGASRSNRLEAQDRVALYAYQQAIEKAGYGFSRISENDPLSSAEFREAVINTSATDLATALDGFEVIADPELEEQPRAVNVHLISYGYAVDYSKVSFKAGNTDKALTAAEAILSINTPDAIYGNSIKGNRTWNSRALPESHPATTASRARVAPAPTSTPVPKCWVHSRGLRICCGSRRQSNSKDQPTTLISMVTDGRPERRTWWDTRKGPGSDSLTGETIPLPDRLGGDAITTSGLIYDVEGNHQFLEGNDGTKPWRRMQRKLNAALDRIAAKADDSGSAVQVEVMGMGDGTDADYPAIYADLFGERTFDKSNGGWSYDYLTSYGLPEFLG